MGPVRRITSLKRHDCRFPTGDDEGGAFFCGEPVQEGSVYCAAHHRLCYVRRPIRGIQIAAILAKAGEGYGTLTPTSIAQRLDVPVDVWMAACSDIEEIDDDDD